jgi:hypothetical protein
LPLANSSLALEQLSALPDRSHAEHAGNLPSHLILAERHLAHAATGRDTRKDGAKSASTDSAFGIEVDLLWISSNASPCRTLEIGDDGVSLCVSVYTLVLIVKKRECQ